jgi:alpha-glucosidase
MHSINKLWSRLWLEISRIVILIGLLLLSALTFGASARALTLSSPDGTIQLTVSTSGAQLKYAVSVDRRPILNASQLGLRLRRFGILGTGAKLLRVSYRRHDGTWNNALGKTRIVTDHYNELRLQLRGRFNVIFEIDFRAFDDGIGFRYVLPRQKGLRDFVVEEEQTEFAFADDYPCYFGQPQNEFGGSQQWTYVSGRLNDIRTDAVTGVPILVHAGTAWVAVTEADLLDWSGMWLSAAPDRKEARRGSTLVTRLAPRLDGTGLVHASTPHHSPWRVLMIARQPGGLVESNLVVNLSTPSKIGEASWVKPGISAWDHWWSGGVRMNTDTIKEYISLASDMGWPYQLIDWQWYGTYGKPEADITHATPAVDMEEVRRFAQAKHVRLWLWLEWTDVARNEAYKKAFPLYRQWGIAGVKIDHMDRDDQEMVNWYEKISKAAAENHLMVNFHGSYKPTGLERTYPNQVTREGILGNEANRKTRDVTSTHKLILLFTRLLAGPADFTPGGLLNRQPSLFQTGTTATQVQGTRAAELALFVLYQSPVVVACDLPAHYRNQPGADFLKIVPTVWDETRVLEAEVPESAIVARRSGNDWFIGALTDDKPRALNVPLHFLRSGRYRLTVWADAKDTEVQAEHLETEHRMVSAADSLVISMAPNGGYVARLQLE